MLFFFCPAIHLLLEQVGIVPRAAVNATPDIDEVKIIWPLAHVITQGGIRQPPNDGEMMGIAFDGESCVGNSNFPAMMKNQSCQFSAIVGARATDYLVVKLNFLSEPNEHFMSRCASIEVPIN